MAFNIATKNQMCGLPFSFSGWFVINLQLEQNCTSSPPPSPSPATRVVQKLHTLFHRQENSAMQQLKNNLETFRTREESRSMRVTGRKTCPRGCGPLFVKSRVCPWATRSLRGKVDLPTPSGKGGYIKRARCNALQLSEEQKNRRCWKQKKSS